MGPFRRCLGVMGVHSAGEVLCMIVLFYYDFGFLQKNSE